MTQQLDEEDKIFYSATRGFFLESRREIYESGDGWPADSVEVDAKQYLKLIDGQNEDKMIIGDDKGYPILVDVPQPSIEQIEASRALMKEQLLLSAAKVIQPLQYAVSLKMQTEEEEELLTSWMKYMVLLNRIDTKAENIEWPNKPA